MRSARISRRLLLLACSFIMLIVFVLGLSSYLIEINTSYNDPNLNAKDIAYREFIASSVMSLAISIGQGFLLYVFIREFVQITDDTNTNNMDMDALSQKISDALKNQMAPSESDKSLDNTLRYLLQSGDLGLSQLQIFLTYGVIDRDRFERYKKDYLAPSTSV